MGSIMRIRNVWLLGLALLGIGGCVQGFLGYLSLHLQDIGWSKASADATLAAFHTLSMIFVIPIALWSDRIGSRLKVLILCAAMVATGVGMVSVAQGALIWIAVCMAGMVRDGFMAVFMTAVLETEGVGQSIVGTAMGLVMVFSGIGNLLAPPIGNSLAAIAPGLPFIFWSGMALFGLGCLVAIRAQTVRKVMTVG